MNKQITTDLVRIGMVNYINVAPIYEPWKRRETEVGWNVIEAVPSRLNRMLAGGELDLGFVSCFEYGAHPELYKILPDLSISANGPVGSVFLFSRVPIKKLDGQKVFLTSHSATSVSLTKVVLEEFYKVQPLYVTGEVMSEERNDCAAVLAIGDEALRIAHEGSYGHKFDLGETWKKQTGLPFVFAICAVREEFCQQNPLLLAEVHRRLLECRMEGGSRLDDICKIAAPRIPMEVDRCKAYLKGIQYDLDGKKREALEKFFSYLIKRGAASPLALPLKVHSFI